MAKSNSELVSNRKAFHDYEVVDSYEAGMVLVGTEVKSLRTHGGSLQDSYILIGKDLKPILKNASIAPYRFGNIYNHSERRDRVLLLHKREILKLKELSAEKGMSLIPLAIYFKNGFIKIKIGCCKGKKLHDKRSSIKEREEKLTIQRAMRKDFD